MRCHEFKNSMRVDPMSLIPMELLQADCAILGDDCGWLHLDHRSRPQLSLCRSFDICKVFVLVASFRVFRNVWSVGVAALLFVLK